MQNKKSWPLSIQRALRLNCFPIVDWWNVCTPSHIIHHLANYMHLFNSILYNFTLSTSIFDHVMTLAFILMLHPFHTHTHTQTHAHTSKHIPWAYARSFLFEMFASRFLFICSRLCRDWTPSSTRCYYAIFSLSFLFEMFIRLLYIHQFRTKIFVVLWFFFLYFKSK